MADALKGKGWADSEPMGQYMAEEHGVAVVPGAFFSPYGGEWIRFSYATPPSAPRARPSGCSQRSSHSRVEKKKILTADVEETQIECKDGSSGYSWCLRFFSGYKFRS